ncbi:MAG: hypothetical protein Q8O59_04460 [bacterium]|nr:hypothetical protein [bacterium]
MSKGSFDFIADHLTVKDGEEVFEYQIIDLSDDILTLIYLPGGNTLKYSRMK